MAAAPVPLNRPDAAEALPGKPGECVELRKLIHLSAASASCCCWWSNNVLRCSAVAAAAAASPLLPWSASVAAALLGNCASASAAATAADAASTAAAAAAIAGEQPAAGTLLFNPAWRTLGGESDALLPCTVCCSVLLLRPWLLLGLLLCRFALLLRLVSLATTTAAAGACAAFALLLLHLLANATFLQAQANACAVQHR